MSLRSTLTILLGSLLAPPAMGADWPQWRGPERTGVSQETGLLAHWPAEGPKLVWQVKNLDDGYSTPAVVARAARPDPRLFSNAGWKTSTLAAPLASIRSFRPFHAPRLYFA